MRHDPSIRFPSFVLILLSFWTSVRSADAPDPRETVRTEIRTEIVQVALRALQPLFSAPEEGKAWIVEAAADFRGQELAATIAWDGKGLHAIRVTLPEVGEVAAAIRPEGSWLHAPRHSVVFAGSASQPATRSPLEDCRLWKVAKSQLGAAITLARLAKLPDDLRLEKKGEGSWEASSSGDWKVALEAEKVGSPVTVRVAGSAGGRLVIRRSTQVPVSELDPLLAEPAATRRETVEDADLRAMLSTAVDMLCEKALWSIKPELVPPLVSPDLEVDGHAVLVVRGSPEEMGKAYGAALKDAIRSNVHRVLHGIGLFQTLRTGTWFPASLAATWAVQEKYVPERYVREMDAIASAVGIPREHARWTNLFPEHFHCSGLGLRGKATEGGRLLHGRILDYMTEVGLQATAVVTVRVPEGHNAWADAGYAGCIGTVTAMNERGLAMGEMGGRGEGHIDGVPMTFLMREVMERFETTDEALTWIRSVPRTCEYFYVLSDAKTKSMAGVASWARSLAKERGTEDLLVLRPGESHPLLPHGIEDAVLMSAGGRYERLVDRVREHHGAITPEVAWKILGEGVAMKSALHIVLFQPETLEFWIAEASLDGRPAYTRKPSKLSMKSLLGRVDS